MVQADCDLIQRSGWRVAWPLAWRESCRTAAMEEYGQGGRSAYSPDDLAILMCHPQTAVGLGVFAIPTPKLRLAPLGVPQARGAGGICQPRAKRSAALGNRRFFTKRVAAADIGTTKRAVGVSK